MHYFQLLDRRDVIENTMAGIVEQIERQVMIDTTNEKIGIERDSLEIDVSRVAFRGEGNSSLVVFLKVSIYSFVK